MATLLSADRGTGVLAEAEEALRRLSEVWRAVEVRFPPDVPSPAAAEARLAAGVAALTGEPMLDSSMLVAVARRIAERLHDLPSFTGARSLVARLERGMDGIDEERLASAVAAGAWDVVVDAAARLGFAGARGAADTTAATVGDADAFALVTLLDYAARPSLRAAAAAVRPVVTAARWGRVTCPACGAPPILSIVHDKDGERVLYCGRCGTGWPFPRLRCASCGERDHRQLGVLAAAGEGEFKRAEVCETCHGYVKSLAALDAPDADALLRLDLASAGLDFAAIEHGYRRP